MKKNSDFTVDELENKKITAITLGSDGDYRIEFSTGDKNMGLSGVEFLLREANASSRFVAGMDNLPAKVLGLIGKTVRHACATTRGEFHLKLVGGVDLIFPPKAQFEAWEFVWHGDIHLVAPPGGSLI